MEKQKITLVTPITCGPETITELHFPRPLCAGDLRGIPLGNMCFEHVLLVAGRLCGQPPKVMDLLQGEDIGEVMHLAQSFLPHGRKTGS